MYGKQAGQQKPVKRAQQKDDKKLKQSAETDGLFKKKKKKSSFSATGRADVCTQQFELWDDLHFRYPKQNYSAAFIRK